MAELARFLALCLVVLASAGAAAETYPDRPVRLIVPLSAGGTLDIASRAVAEKLAERLGQPVIVENRPGGGTVVGTAAVAREAPDGYNLVMGGTAALAVNPTLFKQLPYDPLADFAPVALVLRIPFVLVVDPSLPVRSAADLVALARQRPDDLFFASGGAGTQPHLAVEQLMAASGIRMTHVPYGGTPAGLKDLVAGRIQLIFADTGSALPYIEAGTVRPIAVSSSTRLPLLPDIPTLAESGFPGFDAVVWIMLAAPAGTPRDIVARLHAEIAAIIELPEMRDRIVRLGAIPYDDAPRDLGAFLQDEIARWRAVVERAGLAGSH